MDDWSFNLSEDPLQNEGLSEGEPELTPGPYTIQENWVIPNWTKQSGFPTFTIISSTGANYQVTLKGDSSSSIAFNINLTNCPKNHGADLTLKIMNKHAAKNLKKKASHNFTEVSPSITLRFDLKTSNVNEENGWLQKDILIIKVKVEHTEEEKIFPPFNSTPSDSPLQHTRTPSPPSVLEIDLPRTRRKTIDSMFSVTATQYCGIMNQGATCYMNSILQAFYHLPAFRKIIYEIQESVQKPEDSIIWNLQRLFGKLQTSADPVSTSLLTKSFGWDKYAASRQQDIQEFMRVVIETIENKLKGTPQENDIAHLFRGNWKSFIRCINVDCEKSNIEPFYDLSLDVKGCKTLRESLLKFIEPEKLDHDNQYQTDEFGKQDVLKGIEFMEFPSVLFLHLKRIEYDFNLDRKVKINSRLEFPKTIDLSEFLGKDAVQTKSNVFTLYGIIVHAGEADEGHFYVFLRTNPNQQEQWFEFNDSSVYITNEECAIKANFGGTNDNKKGRFSAYILIYIRQEEIPDIFIQIPQSLIPRSTLERADSIDENRIVHLQVYSPQSFSMKDFSLHNPRQIDVDKHASSNFIYKMIGQSFQMRNYRIWLCSKTGRIFVPLECNHIKNEYVLPCQTFFVSPYNGNINEDIIFVMYFDHHIGFRYLTELYILPEWPVYKIFPTVNQILGIPDDTVLYAFRKVSTVELKELNDCMSFSQCGISGGSVIVVQVAIHVTMPKVKFQFTNEADESKTIKYIDVFPKIKSQIADEYFKMLNDTMEVTLWSPAENILKRLEFPVSIKYSQFCEFIASVEEIDFDIDKQVMYVYNGNSVSPLEVTEDSKLTNVFTNISKLSYQIVDLKQMSMQLRIVYTLSLDGKTAKNMGIKRLKKKATVQDLLDSFNIDAELRAMYFSKSKILRIHEPNELLIDLKNPFRIEIIPTDQQLLNDEEILIPIERVKRDSVDRQFRSIGFPFIIKANPNDYFLNIKTEIQEKMKDENINFEQLKFYLTNDKKEAELTDDIVLTEFGFNFPQIAMLYPPEQKPLPSEGVRIKS